MQSFGVIIQIGQILKGEIFNDGRHHSQPFVVFAQSTAGPVAFEITPAAAVELVDKLGGHFHRGYTIEN